MLPASSQPDYSYDYDRIIQNRPAPGGRSEPAPIPRRDTPAVRAKRMPPAENSHGDNLALGKLVPEGVNVLPAQRVCNDERLRYRSHLEECKVMGYMTETEYDARSAAVDSSETAQALRVLMADLPALPDPEADRREAEAEAKKDAEKAAEKAERDTLAWKLENNRAFRVTVTLIGIMAALITAIVPVSFLASAHAGLLVPLVGVPCSVIGGVSFIVLIINLCCYLDQ